ncbi:MAG: 3-hydroxyacyl-CoA dehydrogenase [Solirubrobacterales bacterium]|nr:3-hydroxyacyl-CoA dehydrogenase [Solirubrobacterales bacterium]
MSSDIKSVTVIGAGVLGSQIAYQSAYCGYSIVAYDVNEQALEAGRARFGELVSIYEREVAGAAGGRARAALARISYSSDLATAVSDADLVIEAAPEKLELKRELYGQLDQYAPETTIFASNSSTLLPSELAASTGRPDRFLALHFVVQVWTHNIAEIMAHPGTDPEVYKSVVEFARSIGMEPIEVHKERPGYVSNSLLVPWLFAAIDLVATGVADPETIDKTWRISSGAPVGPCELLDVIGLVTPYNIMTASPDESTRANARYLKEHYIDKGKLGRASGEGFHSYPPVARAA